MKYNNFNLGQVEAVFNKLGGVGGVEAFLRGELVVTKVAAAVASALLTLSTTSFDPAAFKGLGKGWSIAEQDERSLALIEVDLNKVTFEKMLRSGETFVEGKEKLRRLKEVGHIRLDARVFQLLWENQYLIPESWKSKGSIFFDGTVIRDPDGHRCVLCLYWRDGMWRWGCCLLDGGWGAEDPSACLAS